MRPATVALCFLLAAPAIAESPPPDEHNPAKLKDIRHLLDLTGSAKLGLQVMSQMMSSFQSAMPNVPQKFWNDFQKEATADGLIDLIVPIYDRHLTHAEIKDIIKFYETPSGKKLVSLLPQITQESMEAGKLWGRQLGERIVARLRQQGLGPKP